MYKENKERGKLTRYNKIGQLIQTIQCDAYGMELYSKPTYITANSNGDVLVSDFDSVYDWSGAVVVTERGGRYRFSYIGSSPDLRIKPLGICTDPLSHILVCDQVKIHMIDQDGQFLLYLRLPTESKDEDLEKAYSLSYDVKTHCLWVGLKFENKVYVYNYITQKNAQAGKWEQCYSCVFDVNNKDAVRINYNDTPKTELS